ncbi:MAG: dihydrolipoyl dehydrogenase family protein, partial [Candidatus Dormibacteraceae bacterium]
MADRYDVVIVGAGAAGSEAAFAIAGLPGWSGAIGPGKSRRVLLVESSHLGGTCTNEGCVPTKALVRAARVLHLARSSADLGLRIGSVSFDWGAVTSRMREVRDHQLRFGTAPFEEAGIEVRFPARATFAGPRSISVDGDLVEARSVVIAVGLRPAVPPIPGLAEAGCLDNESALDLRALPRSLAVLGGGPIGCEFAQIFARFGVEVTVVEALERLLPPEEPESSAELLKAFSAEGISTRLGAKVAAVSGSGPGRPKRLTFESGPELEVDEILVAAGRQLDGAALGLDPAGIRWSRKGIEADRSLRASADWAFVAGDVAGGP